MQPPKPGIIRPLNAAVKIFRRLDAMSPMVFDPVARAGRPDEKITITNRAYTTE
jgi:hypothetical protein